MFDLDLDSMSAVMPVHIFIPVLTLAGDLGLADLMADGPRDYADLAAATATDARSLYRVLRLLSSLGLFTEEGRCFRLTTAGERLRGDAPDSMLPGIQRAGHSMFADAVRDALYSVRTGRPAFQRDGSLEFFEHLVANPDESDLFNAAMDDTGHGVAGAVVEAYDFSGFASVVDVGGGNGTLIAAVLDRHPRMTGVLFDLPTVGDGAREAIAGAGLADRCEVVTGDFFDAVPAGADAYLLRWVIHDWDRARALTILRNCRRAMTESSRLLLVETVIPAGDQPHLSKSLDFVMLVAFGGEERTREEYADLLREAGFRLTRIVATESPLSVIEAVPEIGPLRPPGQGNPCPG